MIYPVVFTPSAEQDLVDAKQFYAKVDGRLGQYCVDSLILDTERLAFFAGIHPVVWGYYRMIARSFPYSIYYQIRDDHVIISAILDNRRNPSGASERLSHTSEPH